MNSAKDSEYSAKILNPAMNSAIDLENSAINSAKEYANRNNPAMNSAIVENSAIENNSAKEVFLENKDSAMISTTEPAILLEDSAINSITENTQPQEPSGFKHISEIIKETNTTNPAFSEETEESFSIKKSVFWEKISHLDEFKLKDIENIFPDISERTLRYYLSELVSLGFIEKIGTSGRNVIYRVKK
jgi:predicted HTH transcriptional regulator